MTIILYLKNTVMKNQMVRWIGSIALLAGFTLLFSQCEKAEQPGAVDGLSGTAITERGVEAGPVDMCSCLTANFGLQELSDAEEEALLFMREEEKLARDVYLGLNEQWQAPVFANIARSEQRHMDAILCLIKKYELEDPVGENAQGVFQNATLQEMYNNLMAQGAGSLKDALTVGATIEDVDIFDLLQNIDNSAIDNGDILAAFTELTRGSRNHLRGFIRQLDILGETYQVQYISQEEFNYIISSEREKGSAICGACPNGGGQGNSNGKGGGNGTGACDGSGSNGNTGPNNGNSGGNNNGNGNGGGNTGGNGNGNSGGNGGGNSRGN